MATTEGVNHAVGQVLGMWGAVDESDGGCLCGHVPLRSATQQLVLSLHKALDVLTGGHHAGGCGAPLYRVPHPRVRGEGEEGRGSAGGLGVCEVSPVPADLVGDLQVLDGVLDLVLRQLLDGKLGLGDRAGDEAQAVGRGELSSTRVPALQGLVGGVKSVVLHRVWKVAPVGGLWRERRG